MTNRDPWLNNPFVHYPQPLVSTNRFEFWDNQHGPGIVVINRFEKTSYTVGWLASLILRRFLRRHGDDWQVVNQLGNGLFDLYRRYRAP